MTWCYICEKVVPKDHMVLHCEEGRHCVAQNPDCDHEVPYTCCTCGDLVQR